MTTLRSFVGGFGREPEEESIPTTVSGDACEATLPSSSAVDRLFRGDPWAIPAVIASTALRGVLVGAGAYAAGVRGPAVTRAAIGGALGIEVFVIAFVGYQKWVQAKAKAAAQSPASSTAAPA